MDNDPKNQIEEQEHQELDAEKTEEVAGGKNMTVDQLKRLAAAGEGKDPTPKVNDEDLKKIAAGKVYPDPRMRCRH
jgi:hypothetical protein